MRGEGSVSAEAGERCLHKRRLHKRRLHKGRRSSGRCDARQAAAEKEALDVNVYAVKVDDRQTQRRVARCPYNGEQILLWRAVAAATELP